MTLKASNKTGISLVIVDDHDLVREGIASRLESNPSIKIVGQGANGHEAIALARKLQPDVMLLDISMPQKNGLEAAEDICKASPNTRILFLSIYDNQEYVREAMKAGANGYILKDVSRTEMINAIEAVAMGNSYLGQKLALSLVATNSGVERPCPYGLTDREKMVLSAIAKGLANKEIGDQLGISVRTVESHRASVREKTGGGNAAALAKIATELGL